MSGRIAGFGRWLRRLVAAAGLLLLWAVPVTANGGCSQCDFLITGRDGDSYSATGGNTVCVDESAIFTGSITLKGGTFENCGAAIPSAVEFAPPEGGASGRIVNHGTLRYFSLALLAVTVENHGVLMTYDDLQVGPQARLTNHEGAFVGVGAELRNRGEVLNQGIVDAAHHLRNLGRVDNDGLINAHRQLVNGGEFANGGRINANEQFRNLEDGAFESHGGTLAAFELFNEGLLFGDAASGCNSLLVAGRWRQPGTGRLLGSLDYCPAGRDDEAPRVIRSRTARITSCACFNP